MDVNILPISDVSTDWNASTNITSKKTRRAKPGHLHEVRVHWY